MLHKLIEFKAIGCGLFLHTSTLNHSCVPNAQNYVNGDVQTVRATQFIPKDGEILNRVDCRLQLCFTRETILRQRYGGGAIKRQRCNGEDETSLIQQSYRCCNDTIPLNRDQWNWWWNTSRETIEIKCPKCNRSVTDWWKNCVALVRRKPTTLENGLRACEVYLRQGVMLLSETHVQRCILARSILCRFMHLARNPQLNERLTEIANDLLRVIKSTRGEFSIEHCEAAAFLLDLFSLITTTVDNRLTAYSMVSSLVEMLHLNVFLVYTDYIYSNLLEDGENSISLP